MRFDTLDPVVLELDLPERGLCRGDLGTVVHVYEGDGLEVEFVTAAGRTEALVTLLSSNVRAAGDFDVLSARPVRGTP